MIRENEFAKICKTEQGRYKMLCESVIEQAIDDYKKVKTLYEKRALKNFFLYECDFYLSFLEVNVTGEEIYNSIKGVR